MTDRFSFVAPLWRYPGDAAWYFVSLPTDLADEIEELTAGERRGFGSVKVQVTVGGTTWSTSLFPDTKRATYVLPVKRSVRVSEELDEDDDVPVELTIVEGVAPGR